METLEVMEKVLLGKRLTENTKNLYVWWMKKFAAFSAEWPSSSGVISEFLASLKVNDVTASSALGILKTFGEYMWQNFGVKNPTAGIRRLPVKKRRRRYYDAKELRALIASADTMKNSLLVMTLIDSGARVGDIDDLKAEEVDDVRGKLFCLGKTGEYEYRCSVEICKKLKQLAHPVTGYVWYNETGDYIRAGALSGRIRRIAIKAGLGNNKVGAHTLRHSAASLVAKYTGNPMMVQELLQHSDIAMSMKYVHDAANEIDSISPLHLAVDGLPGPVTSSPAVTCDLPPAAETNGNDVLIPVVPDGVSVRPLLKTEDLRLIRKAFLWCIRSGTAGFSEGDMRDLMSRMLRKAKS
jgi:integrase